MSLRGIWRRARGAPWLVGLPVSLLVHLVVVVTAVAWLRAERTPAGLVVDLTAIVAEREGAAAPRTQTPRDAPPSARAPRRGGEGRGAPAREVRRTETRSAPAAAPPEWPRAPEPSPARPPDVPAERPPVAPHDAPPASPADTAAPATAPATESPSASGASPMRGGEGAGGGAGPAAGGPGAVASGAGSGPGAGTGAAGGTGSGTGADERTAAIGPGTGPGLGNDYAGYLSGLRQRIHESLRYPPAARRRGVSGTVQLEIAIKADGSVGTVTVVASSSHDVLDRAAVDAARALPRMPFPADVRPRPLTVRLPVVFELQ